MLFATAAVIVVIVAVDYLYRDRLLLRLWFGLTTSQPLFLFLCRLLKEYKQKWIERQNAPDLAKRLLAMLIDAFGHLFCFKLCKPACLKVFFQLDLGGRHELTLRCILCMAVIIVRIECYSRQSQQNRRSGAIEQRAHRYG